MICSFCVFLSCLNVHWQKVCFFFLGSRILFLGVKGKKQVEEAEFTGMRVVLPPATQNPQQQQHLSQLTSKHVIALWKNWITLVSVLGSDQILVFLNLCLAALHHLSWQFFTLFVFGFFGFFCLCVCWVWGTRLSLLNVPRRLHSLFAQVRIGPPLVASQLFYQLMDGFLFHSIKYFISW